MLKPIPAAAAIAAATALVVPTVSRADESNSMRVSYADLNLASATGQHTLRGRIGQAAVIVCEMEDSRQLAISTATNLCRTGAIKGAEPAYEAAVASARRGTVTVLGAALVVSAH